MARTSPPASIPRLAPALIALLLLAFDACAAAQAACPLSLATTATVGSLPVALTAGDFNEDGIADLAVVNSGSNTVSVLLGNGAAGVGDGTFAAAVGYATGAGTVATASADFNADGVLDLAVTGTAGVYRLLGNGSGGVGTGT